MVYNANLRQIGAGDTIPARYLPLILWHDGTLELGAQAHLLAHGHPLAFKPQRPAGAAGKVAYFEPTAFWMAHTREHELASAYPVVTPLLVAPLYLPAVAWLDAHGWRQPQIDRVAELMDKLAASVLAAVASVLMYLVLRREGNRWSLPLALAFAFGTDTWMISSQALWQHGSGELLIALALLLVLSPASRVRTSLLGAVCVLVAGNRPPDALVAAAIGLFAVCRCWRSTVWLVAGAVVPLAALLYYNLGFMGAIAGGYGLVKPPAHFFQHNWSGLAGLLVSPTRGLLVFSPFLIFLPVGLARRLRSPESRRLAVALGVAVAAQILLYSRVDWRAGVCWGPRYLTDILPILVWMIAPAPSVLRPFARGLFVVAIGLSVCVQTVGAFWYTKTSDQRIFAGNPASMRAAWNPRNIPFLVELRHPPAGGELQCDAIGTIDRVGDDRLPLAGALPTLKPGATLAGWALACGRTPAQLKVLVDGVVVGSTRHFLSRPGVDKAMHTDARAGWRMSARLWGVPPGERILQLAVRIGPRSDFRIVREQRVFVIAQQPQPFAQTGATQHPPSAAELDAMAARAAELLREHQTDNGAWLTAYTKGMRYQAPRPEMNTYLTSILVDLLSPLHRQGFDAALARARAHLAAQIESDGLVRYQGLSGGPGKRGCVFTPDADDTALVWRIAGPGADDARRRRMLNTLARYRDARGLYRTWLAPQKDYQCLDPSGDPNPTDIGIQMHVYLMLHKFDRPAAQKLCGALQRAFHDADVWPYYAKSALIPYLRAAELSRLGCTLALPTERLALPAPGQGIWSEAVQLLVEATTSPQRANADQADLQRAARALLARLAGDDFALIRHDPPLLYHTDSNVNLPRFYWWSEDVGYALWLRLNEAAGIETQSHPQLSR